MCVGPTFMFSLGNLQILHTNDPDVVKELGVCTSLHFGRLSFHMKVAGPVGGDGVLNSNGALWSQQRKILAPEFFSKKVKVHKHIIHIIELYIYIIHFGFTT